MRRESLLSAGDRATITRVTSHRYWSERLNISLINIYLQLGALDPLALSLLPLLHTVSGPSAFSACSLSSMAVLSRARLSGEAAKTRAKRTRTSGELPPQSPRVFSALARLYYLARPNKTAMQRRLSVWCCKFLANQKITQLVSWRVC